MTYSKTKFYEKLSRKFNVDIKENEDSELTYMIPNTPKLHNFMISLGLGDCDEIIGTRTPYNLYQIYLESVS